MLDVRESPELQAAVIAMKRANKEVRLAIYRETRSVVGGLWTSELSSRAGDAFQQRVLVKGARVKVGTEGFSLMAATSTRALSGGLVPSQQYAGAEFGATPRKAEIQTRSRKGTPYTVTKTIQRQFRSRTKQGRIAMASASKVGTRAVALWVKAIVDVYADAAGGTL